VLGTNGLPRTDPDRFAFLIANTALGGGMSSRLFQEIRERRGLAYTAYSYHAQYTETGLFSAYAGTSADRAKQVVALMRQEIEAIRDGGLTEEEFERAGHVKGRPSCRSKIPAGGCRVWQGRDQLRRDPHGGPRPARRRGDAGGRSIAARACSPNR
jgi:hypothetical protein